MNAFSIRNELVRRACALVISALLLALAGITSADTQPAGPAARSYLQLPHGGDVAALPYEWQRSAGGKQLVVLGTRHIGNARSPMYDRIEAAFARVQPQVLIHESQAPADLANETRESAIARGADLGFAARLAFREHVPLRSGDAPLREEISALMQRHSAQEVFVFLTAQRLVGSARNPDLRAAALAYPAFARDELAANGLELQPQWREWDGFAQAFRQLTGNALSRNTWDPQLLNPLRDSGRLSDVVRDSEAIRDRYLLAAIRDELSRHDRVMVVFGCWHVLAIEPLLPDVLPTR